MYNVFPAPLGITELPPSSYTYVSSSSALSPGLPASDPVSPAAPRTATLGYRSDPVSPHPCRTNFHPYQNTIISPHTPSGQVSTAEVQYDLNLLFLYEWLRLKMTSHFCQVCSI